MIVITLRKGQVMQEMCPLMGLFYMHKASEIRLEMLKRWMFHKVNI